MVRRTLVTGAGGFLGGALVRHFAAARDEVIAMSRKPIPLATSSVEQWLVDDLLSLPEDSGTLLACVDSIVHCAGRAHMLADNAADPLAEFRKANVAATLTLARMAAEAGVKRFIFISSIGVNGSQSAGNAFSVDDVPAPKTPYALSKWEAEQALFELAEKTDMRLYVVRPPMIYGANAPGNFALLAKMVCKGWPLPFGALDAPRSFVSLENMVDLLVHLVRYEDAPAGTYLVSDGECISTTIFIREMARALHKSPWLIPVPANVLEFMAGLVGRAEQIRKMAVPLAIDITSTRERLAWAPHWSLEQSMRKALAGKVD